MKRTPICPDLSEFPTQLHSLLAGAQVYDSSCSNAARVYYVEKEGGFYIKTAPAGQLRTEAEMTRYLHSRDLAAQVLHYETGERDWLVTCRVPGEDCIHPQYIQDPKRLCDILAKQLRALHEMDFSGCPVPNRMETYAATARRNYLSGQYDCSLFPDNWGYSTAEEAWQVICAEGDGLKPEVLIHGDYCLPNIMLDNWRFSGFIDVGNGGIADRHIDLFWAVWSLGFNLKTDAYRQRFLDAYGADLVEPDKLRIVAAFEVFG